MSHTTAEAVRKALPHLLIDEDIIGVVSSGKTITLTNPAYDVPDILQDSATLVKDTDFTFIRSKAVTLAEDAAGEHYIATVYIGASDDDLDTIITRSDRMVDDAFAKYTTPSSSYLADWSTWLAASIFLREYATATEENIRRAEALEKLANNAMESYKSNSAHNTEKSYPTRKTVIKVN